MDNSSPRLGAIMSHASPPACKLLKRLVSHQRGVAGCRPPTGSEPVLLQQPAADDHLLDVGRALTDQQHRSLPVEPLYLVLLGVAVAPVDAEGVLDDFLAVLAGEVLGHPGLEVVALAGILAPG